MFWRTFEDCEEEICQCYMGLILELDVKHKEMAQRMQANECDVVQSLLSVERRQEGLIVNLKKK